ncbi:MAG TPA: RHS repeat-associated core domain-containing protein [Paraburkholderia sp.]|nr:RHS repeat-associated core domain-containing protein [Paraburkholderia sp.]
MHYDRHRYYDPTTERFISKDSIGLAGGIKLYQYANNPALRPSRFHPAMHRVHATKTPHQNLTQKTIRQPISTHRLIRTRKAKSQ